ncbi:MAG TPA: prepilin-type N-terminal cleavage/methylation domain-containing protein [Candidatus Ozemobacteraceae bacterium]|mgnify:CR=1 FL=1|nr:prepilin-type N-terminal cleavage/methylation domain-containing protein [Candidatus Ozemobacteraceae bacterium]
MRRDARGFTLMEILLAVVLTGLFLTVISQVFLIASRMFGWGTQRIFLNQELRSAVSWLKRDLRAAGWHLTIENDGHSMSMTQLQSTSDGLPLYDPDGFNREQDPVRYAFHFSDGRGILTRNDRQLLSGLSDMRFNIKYQMICNKRIPVVGVEVAWKVPGAPTSVSKSPSSHGISHPGRSIRGGPP